jgi:hypothetical protein
MGQARNKGAKLLWPELVALSAAKGVFAFWALIVGGLFATIWWPIFEGHPHILVLLKFAALLLGFLIAGEVLIVPPIWAAMRGIYLLLKRRALQP